MTELPEDQIKQAVRRRYAALATLSEPCCSSGTCTTIEAGEIPEESVATAASCGSPLAHAQVQAGNVVLDLGSGGGIDVFRTSKLVGPTGKVIGVDSTPEMIFKAREVAGKYGYRNVEFKPGEIEHLPVESNSVDIVISNCVLNLVPDKALAFREIYRVLKPGGKISISDIVATRKSTKDQGVNPEDWAACIAGAITIDEYNALLQEAGFQDIKYLDETSGVMDIATQIGSDLRSVTWSATKT